MWAKLPSIIDSFNQFPDAQWVWWLDSDAIIMSPEVDLSSQLLSHDALFHCLEKEMEIRRGSGGGRTEIFTPKNPDVSQIDIIVSQDHNGLNAGSFFIRRSQFTKMLMDLWADPQFINARWASQEQEALLRLVLNHKFVRDHVGYVSQRVLNAYPFSRGWSPGDLVVHFAGCWVDDRCAEQFDDFWNRRKTVAQVKEEREREKETEKEREEKEKEEAEKKKAQA